MLTSEETFRKDNEKFYNADGVSMSREELESDGEPAQENEGGGACCDGGKKIRTGRRI